MSVCCDPCTSGSRQLILCLVRPMPHALVALSSLIAVAILTGCATAPSGLPARFYSYWQPTSDGTGVMGIPTRYYRELFMSRGPAGKFFDDTERHFYYAASGDRAALHDFMHSPLRDQDGSGGEGWVGDMVVLALAYGDDRLAPALSAEDAKTKAEVCTVVRVMLFPGDRAAFQKTLSLCGTNRPNQAMQRTADRSAFPVSKTSTFNLQRRSPSPAVADLVSR